MIAFLDHPLGERNGDAAIRHADNMSSAVQWLRFLSEVTRWAIDASWYAHVVADVPHPRRLVDAVRIVERCDLYVMSGGVVSPHMNHNSRAARRAGVPILDLTMYGVVPPNTTDEAAALIAARAMRSVAGNPRRVWMPLLTPEDIKHLMRARMHYIDEDAIAILDRILAAAQRSLNVS